MSTPTNDFGQRDDAPLVEPRLPSEPTSPLDALDTARILGQTQSIPTLTDTPVPSIDSERAPERPQGSLNVLAIVSLVLAIAVSPLAMIFGYIAIGQIRRHSQRGEGLAWAAVGLGWIWAVLYVVATTVLVITWFGLA